MAYDRYDSRRGSREHSRHPDDHHRGRDQGGGRDERGFFERAGEQISSWFGEDDDDDNRRGRYDEPRGGRSGQWRSEQYRGSSPDQDRAGWFGGDDHRERSMQRPARDRQPWGGGDMDRDHRSDERGGYRPITGDYGRSEDRFAASGYGARDEHRGGGSQSKWDRDEYRRTSFAGSSDRSQHHDPHYQEWRQRQIDELDRDYDEYRREHQSKFENDFGGWRQTRQTKRQMLGQIREQMEVVGSDNEHVGTVDRIAGDRIILTKSDPEAGGSHHSLSCTDLDRIEGDRIILGSTAENARKNWRDENRDRALFEREDSGEAGPHTLERSFSGTYR